MTTGLIYGFIGFLFGAICGGALLGPIGGLFGAVIGGGTGHFLGKLFHVGFAQMAATKPVRVTCPASGEDVKLRIDPKEAGWAAFHDDPQTIKTCPRWQGSPHCHRRCERQIDI
jgi:hypothetical protein